MLWILLVAEFLSLAGGVLAHLAYQNATSVLKPPFNSLKAKTFTAIE